MIVATAGHVDHGKTSLVRALTGVDTDRLPEEKRRGMSIDLGFAYLPATDGARIAFVDVPGHERFVRNMAAGVQGIDLALLVVAADDGPMPQTREHLQILDRLGAPRLVAALTKVDRVAPERAAEARAEVEALLATGRFAGAEVLPLSPVTGDGLDRLRKRLAEEAHRAIERDTTRRFRLHVDRAFVMDGLGLIATGTVISGSVAVGDELQVLPRGLRARVRSLRADNTAAERASAGQRCALALQGLGRGEVERGDSLAASAPVSKMLDVALEPFDGARVKDGMAGVHLGTGFHTARLVVFGRFGRLSFPQEVSACHGDRLLLRDPGTQKLLAAGKVVDPLPPARGAARPQRLALLEAIAGKPAQDAFDALLDLEPGVLDTAWFGASFHLEPAELRRLVSARPLHAFATQVMREGRWREQCDRVLASLAAFHAAQPDAIGPKPAEIGSPLPTIVQALADDGRLLREGPRLRLPGHAPVLSREDEALWQRFAPVLPGEGLRAPRVHELSAQLQMEPKAVSAFLERAARAGRVHRVASNRYFLPESIASLVALATDLAAEYPEGFTVRAFRDRSALGRNLTIEVLEYLDAIGATRRSRDLRNMKVPA
ncbi:MAG: selenocysteine-specific translation elongation factor [Betaproteobacteria bacterium]